MVIFSPIEQNFFGKLVSMSMINIKIYFFLFSEFIFCKSTALVVILHTAAKIAGSKQEKYQNLKRWHTSRNFKDFTFTMNIPIDTSNDFPKGFFQKMYICGDINFFVLTRLTIESLVGKP